MSTNSGIAVRAGETFQTIYCRYDGYPKYMFPMLRDNYNSLELALKLISYGDASYIEKELEPTSDFHKFGTPEPGICMFYHRDRGEDWLHVAPVCYTEKELFRQSAFEYVYIFEYGEWNIYVNGKKVSPNTFGL